MRPAVSGSRMLWKSGLDWMSADTTFMFYFRQTGRVQGAKFSQAGIEFLRDKTR